MNVETGVITKAARRDARVLLGASALFVAVVAAVLAANWKYLYNWAAGPFPFGAAAVASPGPHEFFRAQGTMMPSGLVQETTLRLLRGAVETKSVTASYLVMVVDGRPLVVKVASDFSGSVVQGRLVPLPESVRTSLSIPSLYPWLLDAETAYRWDFNLFVMVAAPLFPLCLLLLGVAVWSAGRVDRHTALSGLKHLGPLDGTIRSIERELATTGRVASVAGFSITPSWIVRFEPSLTIYAVQDLMGIGHEKKTTTSGGKATTEHKLRVWLRGRLLSDSVRLSEADIRAVLDASRARWPWAIVEDVAGFDRKWSSRRDSCEKEIDAKVSPARTVPARS